MRQRVALFTLPVVGALLLLASPAAAGLMSAEPTWLRLPAGSAPEWGEAASAGFDADTGQVLMFGGEPIVGQTGDFDTNETWQWQYATSSWVLLNPSSSPSRREQASLVFDPVTHQMLLYGGVQVDGALWPRDTWQWDGSTWKELVTTAAPPEGSIAAYDGHAHEVVAVGNGAAGPETWLWSGTSWSRSAPATQAPAGRLIFDRTVNRLLSLSWVNGVLRIWAWDGRTWSVLPTPATTPPPLAAIAAAYNPALGGTVLMGRSASGMGVWLFKAGSWVVLPTPAFTTSETPVLLVWNGRQGQMLLFDIASVLATPQNSTWTLRAPTSTTLALAPATPTAGSPVTLAATVHADTTTAASGKVEFFRDGAPISGCLARPLSKGVATCSTTLPRGSQTLVAQYLPSNAYLGSSATVVASLP